MSKVNGQRFPVTTMRPVCSWKAMPFRTSSGSIDLCDEAATFDKSSLPKTFTPSAR